MYRPFSSASVSVCAGFVIVVLSTSTAGAQHGGMHGAAPMQETSGTQQMLQKLDGRLSAAAATMRDLTAQHAAMPPDDGHAKMVALLQGMLSQMQQLYNTLADTVKDPMMASHGASTKALDQTVRDVDQMAAAFDATAKSVGRMMKDR